MHPCQSQRGYMLLLVPVIVIAICLMGYRMASRSKTTLRVAASELDNLRVKLCAQQCVSVAANRVQASLERHQPVPAGESPCPCRADPAEEMACDVEIGRPSERTVMSCYGYY